MASFPCAALTGQKIVTGARPRAAASRRSVSVRASISEPAHKPGYLGLQSISQNEHGCSTHSVALFVSSRDNVQRFRGQTTALLLLTADVER